MDTPPSNMLRTRTFLADAIICSWLALVGVAIVQPMLLRDSTPGFLILNVLAGAVLLLVVGLQVFARGRCVTGHVVLVVHGYLVATALVVASIDNRFSPLEIGATALVAGFCALTTWVVRRREQSAA